MRIPPHLSGPGLGALLALIFGCGQSSDPPWQELEATGPAWFEDVTDAVGLHFVHDPGPEGTYFMTQIVGSGAALFDYDGDGRLDVYLVHNAGPKSQSTNRLFHQRPDGHFEDVSAGSGLDVAGWGMGVAIGDVNNDGRPDVLLTEYGGCRLFLNDGRGHFTEVTEKLVPGYTLWATSACFFDYDRDGWLDLVVTNYVEYKAAWPCTDDDDRPEFCHPSKFPGSVTRLFHNRGCGPDGHWRGFEDVTEASGLAGRPGPGLGVVCADFDGDGWPDIFIANDARPNHLWMNRHDGTFREEAVRRGLAFDAGAHVQGNMGIALGDVAGDGLFDLYVTHLMSETNTLWKQGPQRGFFRDQTEARGLARTQWAGTGFGTVFADFDHDGALDLAIVNGRVGEERRLGGSAGASFWSGYAQRNQLLTNDGNGHFRDLSAQDRNWSGTPGVYRGLACGDVDNDGALDLLVTQIAGPARLFRNVAPKRGHWLMISAVDPARGGRDAYGAEVTVLAGPRRWVRWLNPGYSYLTSNDPRVHFGLGPVEHVDAIRVLWPDGLEEQFPGRDVDRLVQVRRGQGAGPGSR